MEGSIQSPSPPVAPSHQVAATVPPSQSGKGSSNIIFTILLCGLGLLFLYLVFRIKKLEVSINKMEQRQQQYMQQGIRGWFQNEENIEFVEHCLLHRKQLSFYPPPSNRGKPDDRRVRFKDVEDEEEKPSTDAPPAAPLNPLSGLMQMCGVPNIFGPPAFSANTGVVGVTIGIPEEEEDRQNETYIVEIEEVEEDSGTSHPPLIEDIEDAPENSDTSEETPEPSPETNVEKEQKKKSPRGRPPRQQSK